MLAPEEELIAGRRPVEEAFVAGRPAHRLLVVPQRRQALERLVLHATNLRIPVVEVEGGTLTSLAGFDGHQGIAIAVDPRQYATPDDILARAIERGEPPFVLALDSLEDPQNVGTLLRSAEAAGVHGVLFPTRRQAPLTPAAIKASAGAVEHLLLAPVDDLPAALADLHIRGLRVAGAEADAPLTASEADLRGPLAIVVGSEGQGLGPAIRKRTDVLMRIPMRGVIDSLNAAVAGSILLFEAVAQRGLPERSPGTARPVAALPGVLAPGGDAGEADGPDASAAAPAPPHLAEPSDDTPGGSAATPDAARPVRQRRPRTARARPSAEADATAQPSGAGDDLLPGGPGAAPSPGDVGDEPADTRPESASAVTPESDNEREPSTEPEAEPEAEPEPPRPARRRARRA